MGLGDGGGVGRGQPQMTLEGMARLRPGRVGELLQPNPHPIVSRVFSAPASHGRSEPNMPPSPCLAACTLSPLIHTTGMAHPALLLATGWDPPPTSAAHPRGKTLPH